MSGIIVFIGLTLIFQLINLQVLGGAEYRIASQSRLFREASLQAPRGQIFDRNGLLLATNREAFDVQIVKVSIEPQELNHILLSLAKILEKNGDSYRDNFPMTLNPIKLDMENNQGEETSKVRKFKQQFKVTNLNISDQKLFEDIRSYYNIPNDFSVEDARKVIALRYEMTIQPLSQFDPVIIAVDVSKETVAELEERHLDFPGISISVQPVREYPNGSIAAHIIGYIGKINDKELKENKDEGYTYNDLIGKNGLENALEKLLRGKDGLKRVEMNLMGRQTGEIGGIPPEPGNDIYLSIDLKLQKVAEKSLKDTIDKINSGGYADSFEDARSGAVVAIDVKNGEVLALANYPSYDPSVFVKSLSTEDRNKLMDSEQKPMFNRAIQGLYSPGSTFKMVTATSVLQENKIGINDRVQDKGVYTRYKGYTPKCWIWRQGHRTHGYVNVSDAIKVSCNYFFYEMGYRAGIDNINKYARMFGLGSKTGIELPNEKEGILAGPDYRELIGQKWYPGDTLQAAIGQSDYSFTPLQMANYVAILANGGNRNTPHLILKATSWKKEPIDESKIKSLLVSKLGNEVNRPTEKVNLGKENLNAILEGMKSVAGDAGGTAYATFSNFAIPIGGKTGTVQVPGHKSDNAWFVGFAPYDNPQIAVVVIIEHGGHGAYTAPVVRDVIGQYFGIYKDESIDANKEQSN